MFCQRLFGDEIEQIRAFDPDTQRSLYPVKEVRLLPGHEFPFDDEDELPLELDEPELGNCRGS